MDKVIALKTQLEEAAKFAYAKSPAHKRIGAILLDNFVEIQLLSLIKNEFDEDDYFSRYKRKKYLVDRRKEVLRHYDKLLQECVKANIITQEEKQLMKFGHAVRNNLYHDGKEDKLLKQVAIILLSDIIHKYQPKWKSTRWFTAWAGNTKDPYSKNTSLRAGNSELDWTNFLNKYFKCYDGRIKSVSKLLSDYLLNRIWKTEENVKFVTDEYENYFEFAKGCDYNRYFMHFSFYVTYRHQMERIKERESREEGRRQMFELAAEHRRDWKNTNPIRLKVLKAGVIEMARLPTYQALEKFNTYKLEIDRLFEAFSYGAKELDSEIDIEAERAREEGL